MISLNDIISDYGVSIKKSIRQDIEKYIHLDIAQDYVKKALGYNLTDEDERNLYKIGNCKGLYPRLYYLCCIYIHPLTRVQYILKVAEKIEV